MSSSSYSSFFPFRVVTVSVAVELVEVSVVSVVVSAVVEVELLISFVVVLLPSVVSSFFVSSDVVSVYLSSVSVGPSTIVTSVSSSAF